jgi:hypothetical protein
MYSGKIAVPPDGGGIVFTVYNTRFHNNNSQVYKPIGAGLSANDFPLSKRNILKVNCY